MAFFNEAGLIGFLGFGILAVLWFVTALNGYRAIRVGDIERHRAWMIRTFALTYAAVTLRLSLVILIMVQSLLTSGSFNAAAAFSNAYLVVPFLCWVPNLLVAELLIRHWGLPGLRRVRPEAGAA